MHHPEHPSTPTPHTLPSRPPVGGQVVQDGPYPYPDPSRTPTPTPNQVVAKSCKMVPVMLMGYVVSGRRYTCLEYAMAASP